MESKPVISYAGDANLFNTLQFGVLQGLPVEPVEWRRSYGRAPKTVYVETTFVPFEEEILPQEGQWKLIGQTFLHTFWTDCSDIDVYRTTVKNSIDNWLMKLRNKNIYDWIIISVETMDSRKGNKAKLLPRASVLDKIKNEFCSRQPDRCVVLLDPLKSDSRGAESWQALLHRIRQLLLQAYNRNLSKFEEHMRSQRERRNEPGWSFCDYFILQEELAFVFEMLGIFDEALVQYDELDALFTQFVLNSNVGDTPDWLGKFSRVCNSWVGLTMNHSSSNPKRELIQSGTSSLLDLRNYLFSRQCSLLLLLYRPWEIAQRTLPFVHNCINELKILEVEMPRGSVSCWVFLTCLEVLTTCERFNDSGQVEAYSLYTASLWAYARDKLQELGKLCGLMPGVAETSEQLHMVVGLLSGMTDEGKYIKDQSPMIKLREALSSKDAFQKHYLELSELAMGTFKHIGRIRSARLIGRDLAHFHMKLDEPQKAAAFLTDAVKTYKEENWEELLAETYLELAKCYKAMNDFKKYIVSCIHIAGSSCLEDTVRNEYFKEVMIFSEKHDVGNSLLLSTDGIFVIKSVKIVTDSTILIPDSDMNIHVVIFSRLPDEVHCKQISVSQIFKDNLEKKSSILEQEAKSRNSSFSNLTLKSGDISKLSSQPMFKIQFTYNEDNSLKSASVLLANEHQSLSRRDSQSLLHKNSEVIKGDFSMCFSTYNTSIKPGNNDIIIAAKVGSKGKYCLNQLSIQTRNIDFVTPHNRLLDTYEVNPEPQKIYIKRTMKEDLLAGVEQTIYVCVDTGSNTIEPDTILRLQAHRGLLLKVNGNEGGSSAFVQAVEMTLPIAKPFETVSCIVKVLVELGPQKEGNSLERKIFVSSPWMVDKQEISLGFVYPFSITTKLHSVKCRKFIAIAVQGLQLQPFFLKDSGLAPLDAEVEVTPLNTPDSCLEIKKNQAANYMWEMKSTLKGFQPAKFEFSISYCPKWDNDPSAQFQHFVRNFTIADFKTLYTVHSKVEPKGLEFCRVGNMCNMHIQISNVNLPNMSSLMYEVLADQTFWAVCGRTAGVVSLDDSGSYSVTLDVMPLSRGFLPLPAVRLSKYIPADQKSESPKKDLIAPNVNMYPRLQPFGQGQVYNWSKALQIHVLPASSSSAHNEGMSI